MSMYGAGKHPPAPYGQLNCSVTARVTTAPRRSLATERHAAIVTSKLDSAMLHRAPMAIVLSCEMRVSYTNSAQCGCSSHASARWMRSEQNDERFFLSPPRLPHMTERPLTRPSARSHDRALVHMTEHCPGIPPGGRTAPSGPSCRPSFSMSSLGGDPSSLMLSISFITCSKKSDNA